jgi:hypothetical protein
VGAGEPAGGGLFLLLWPKGRGGGGGQVATVGLKAINAIAGRRVSGGC